MAFVVMAVCITVCLVVFFFFAPDMVGVAAGMAAAAMIASWLIWIPIYFDLV